MITLQEILLHGKEESAVWKTTMKVVLLILLLLVFEGQVSRAGKKKKVKGSAAKKTNSLFVGKLNALLCVEYEKR